MRYVDVPVGAILKAVCRPLDEQPEGNCIVVPTEVDWPELQLTDEQKFANAMALGVGKPMPYPDHALFSLRLPIVLLP